MRISEWIISNVFGAVPIIGPYLRHDFQTATSETIKCIIVLMCENVGMFIIGHVHNPADVALNTAAMIGGVTAGTITYNVGAVAINHGNALLTQYRSHQQIQNSSTTTDEEGLQLVPPQPSQRSTMRNSIDSV